MQESISEGGKKQTASGSAKYYTANVYTILPSARAHLNSCKMKQY